MAKQTQSRDTKERVEHVNHVSWPVRNPTHFGVLHQFSSRNYEDEVLPGTAE